jgi:hypothetical protein
MVSPVSQALTVELQTLAREIVRLYREGLESQAEEIALQSVTDLLSRYSLTYVVKSCTKVVRESIYQEYYGYPFPGKQATEEERKQYFSSPVTLFSQPRELRLEISKTTEKNLSEKRAVKICFPDSLIDKLLSKALEILRNDGTRARDYYAKGLALELLTGRRQFSEICFSAEFQPVDNHTLYVSGIAKSNIEGLEIPVIGTDTLEISQALEEVREFITSREWFTEETTSRDVKSKIDKITRDILSREFQPIVDSYYSDLRQTYKKGWVSIFPPLSSHDFRALWVVICHKRINRELSDLGLYASKILGHTSERNTRHYQTYRIVSDTDFQSWKDNEIPRLLG